VLASQRRMRESSPKSYRVPTKIRTETGRMAYRMESDEKGELIVWRPPREGREYRIGCDVSEGIEVGRDTDFSVAIVLDAETYEECACLRTKIDPDLLSWQLVSLGRWFNKALLTVESNNHGLVTLKFLQEVHRYPNLYFDKTLDERSNRSTRKIGFKTSIKTRPVLVDYLKELIREKLIEIHSPVVLDELQTFVFMPNGKAAAQSGSHDDCVMALALAALSCKLHPWSSTSMLPDYYVNGTNVQEGWGLYVPPRI